MARATDALARAIAERPPAERPRLVRVPDRFVAGEETALVRAVADRAAKPTGRRPFEQGILVQNVETLAHLALVARHGAGWFRSAGTDAEPGTALATVGGAVARAGVVELELGSTLGDLVDRCGGLTERPAAVLIGGYFGRWLPYFVDLELANDALRPLGASLGARVIVPLPRSACGLREVARVARYLAGESAGQCGPCVFGLRALADELDALVRGAPTDARRVASLGRQILGRGGCAHPDGAVGFVASGLELFADEIDAHRRGRCTATSPRAVLPVP
jgi:NADH:ubiquinone oxidoreductase subunit F (NADH-binding)